MACLDFAYEGSLRASLMRVKYEDSIETAQDILDTGTDLFMSPGSEMFNMFSKSVVPVRQAIYKRAVERGTVYKLGPNLTGVDIHRERVRRSEFFFKDLWNSNYALK